MSAVHRSFYSSIIIAVEKGLVDFCHNEGIVPSSHRLKKAEKIIERAELKPGLAKQVKDLAGSRPSFNDYLREVLKARALTKERRMVWNYFFEALNVVRNKVSHSDVNLSQEDIRKLQRGGFSALVGADKKLQVNTRNYKQIIDFVLQFYKELKLE